MMFQTSPALGVPMGLVYAVIPLSSLLMLLYLTKDTIDFVRGGFGRSKPTAKEGE